MQVEDPRKQWEIEQERMLKDYLMVSQHHLQVCEKHLLKMVLFIFLISVFLPSLLEQQTPGFSEKQYKTF
jgi:uncharacterized membrane protein affecting hemolysin expression